MSDILTVEFNDSTLLDYAEYNEPENEITIYFKKYFVNSLTYINFSQGWFEEFIKSPSVGKFYLNHIKPNFTHKTKHKIMADKVIKCKINVREIIKKYIFAGEKGDYLNFTILYNEEQDQYGNNGMIVQDVPSEIFKAEKSLPADKKSKGAILGNCKIFAKTVNEEAKVGVDIGILGGVDYDDLPF